ncbi:MAG: IPT/TIG domain-containing protein [Methylococcales bacterium]
MFKHHQLFLKLLLLFCISAFSTLARADTFSVSPTTGYINDTVFNFNVSITNGVPAGYYIGMSLNGSGSARLPGSGKNWSYSTKSSNTGTFNVKYHLHKDDGTKVGDLSWSGSFSVSAPPPAPTVSSVSPTSATAGIKTTFTVYGSNLPSTIALNLDGSSDCSMQNVSSTSASVSCTPYAGNRRFYVADVPNGLPMSGSTSLYVNVSPVPTAVPTAVPTVTPTAIPTLAPTVQPTATPAAANI